MDKLTLVIVIIYIVYNEVTKRIYRHNMNKNIYEILDEIADLETDMNEIDCWIEHISNDN